MKLRAIQGLAPLFSFFVAPMVESTRSMDIHFIKNIYISFCKISIINKYRNYIIFKRKKKKGSKAKKSNWSFFAFSIFVFYYIVREVLETRLKSCFFKF